ncbi:MAG: proline--tRNA ligase [Candidatus Aenigmarchaeota archaeon ex4484_224]|nr:MAG: proline--tRNA ligase [Candidatus Aenigmarchaeota archaeon ex4484_224]
MSEELGITVKKEENFSEWYTEVILKAELADYAPTKGCMIIKPFGYAIWEKIQEIFNKMIKDEVKNVYFPLLIPERILKKEAEHIRPTSETIMYEYFSKWIDSWRDLPLRINQWCNIVRWETKSTKLFLRTREFLWQEGHTAHSTKEEADKEVMKRLLQYKELIEKYLAIPVLIGKKSEGEKFAGALYTTTLEALMPDGRALQMGTSHNLGQNFAKVFDIQFWTKEHKREYVWQTSWGITTRLIGALVMVHGDDKGLVLPPKISPIQVVIIPIYYNENEKRKVLEKAKEIKEKLKEKFEVELDDRDQYTPGFKFNYWELKGIPLRIEIGPKDLKEKTLVLARRDTLEKIKIKENELIEKVKELLEDVQESLFKKAKKFLEERIFEVKDCEEFKKRIENREGFVKIEWCSSLECEEKIKEEIGATCRLISFDEKPKGKKCLVCGKEAKVVAYFAKAY